jgi:hypothetical protein
MYFHLHLSGEEKGIMKSTITANFAATIATLGFNAAHAQPNPPGVNPEHYACYRVSPAKPFKAMKVELKDQFGGAAGVVVQEASLCAPVSKNGQPIKDERTHLLCYTLKMNKSGNKAVEIVNQFGKFVMKVGPITQLCVPSLKQVL